MIPARDGLFAGLYLIDSDTHFSEPYDLWTSRAPAKYRDLVPQVRRSNGDRAWYINGNTRLADAGAGSFINREGNKEPYLGFDITEGRVWEDIHAASHDPKQRLAMMDDMGVWAQIIYPNVLGFFAASLTAHLPRELAYQCVKMYNDAIIEMQEAGEGRLLPQAVLPIWNMDDCLTEVQRVADLGITGLAMTDSPQSGGLPDLADPYWDPFYELVSELELPLDCHILFSANADLKFDVAWPSLEKKAHKPVNSVQMELSNSRFISNIVVSDIFDRWPKLKWVSVESGIGWIPYVLERVDYEYREEFPGEQGPKHPPALEVFRDHIYACFWFEDSGPNLLIDYLGADNIMWETDFPHPTCLYPSPVERSAEALKGLSPDVIRKIMQDNAADLYKLKLPIEV